MPKSKLCSVITSLLIKLDKLLTLLNFSMESDNSECLNNKLFYNVYYKTIWCYFDLMKNN